MRLAPLVIALLLAARFEAAAGGPDRPRARDAGRNPDVDVFVPVDPHEHERLHFFDGKPHGLVPRVIAVDKPAYVCGVEGRTFRTEDDFLFHLRSAHALSWDDIGTRLVVHDGQVHYLGR